MIEGVFYIESQGNNERVVKMVLEELVRKLKDEKGLEVQSTSFGRTTEEGGSYSTTVEVELSFETFKNYLMAAIRYGPSAITLDSPEKIKMTADEFLSTLGEVTAFTKLFLDKYGMYFTFPPPEEETKVGLDEDEIDALLDQGAYRVKIVVEKEEDEEEAKQKFLSAIGKEAFIHNVKTSKVKDRTLVAVHAFVYEPKSLFDISIKHSPVLIKLVEPAEVVLSLYEIQDIGVELAATYFELSHITLDRASPS